MTEQDWHQCDGRGCTCAIGHNHTHTEHVDAVTEAWENR